MRIAVTERSLTCDSKLSLLEMLPATVPIGEAIITINTSAPIYFLGGVRSDSLASEVQIIRVQILKESCLKAGSSPTLVQLCLESLVTFNMDV